MSNCRFLTPCGICEIKSMSGVPYECDLRRNNNLDPRTKTPIASCTNCKHWTEAAEVKPCRKCCDFDEWEKKEDD